MSADQHKQIGILRVAISFIKQNGNYEKSQELKSRSEIYFILLAQIGTSPWLILTAGQYRSSKEFHKNHFDTPSDKLFKHISGYDLGFKSSTQMLILHTFLRENVPLTSIFYSLLI
jgi:hypothetical protein